MSLTKKPFPQLAILLAALIWGGAFIVMKDALDAFPSYWLLTIRFFLAAALLAIGCFKKLRYMNKQYLIDGLILGFFLSQAYGTQTVGLETTTPGKNAFLTTTYCILVPFFNWIFLKKKPFLHHLIAAIICVAGIGCITLGGDLLTVSKGDALSALCGVFYALHIVTLDIKTKKQDIMLLTISQFFFCGLFSLVTALCLETPPASVPKSVWLSFAYLVLLSTIGSIVLQAFGQKYTPPTNAAILMSFESVFAALLSLILGRETFSLMITVGFVLMFSAVLIAQRPEKSKSTPAENGETKKGDV